MSDTERNLRRVPGDGASPGAPPLVLAARVMLLLAASLAVFSGFALARARERATRVGLEVFVCPMHPEVSERAPGLCPICRMALEASPQAAMHTRGGSGHGEVETVERRLFSERVEAPAWVNADGSITASLYRDELLRLAPDEPGQFFSSRAPAAGLPVRRTPGSPSAWDDSTSRIRFRPDPGAGPRAARIPGQTPRAGEVGWIQLDPAPRESLVVPWSAVLYSTSGPYVLAEAGGAAGAEPVRRPVEVGRTLYAQTERSRVAPNAIVVLSGLHAGERIVAGDTFASDAERRLETARQQVEELTP